MIGFDDLKVALASGTGLSSWLLDIDVILKVAISVATLVYIIIKTMKLKNN